jgi:hypothetical protein
MKLVCRLPGGKPRVPRAASLILLITVLLLGVAPRVQALGAQKSTPLLDTADTTATVPVNPANPAKAETTAKVKTKAKMGTTVPIPNDSLRRLQLSDSLVKAARGVKAKKTFIPDPQRALWLALVIPGGGQIYNRKYWKLPLVYGGFVGCIYALRWNNQMYKDYSQAYLDIMDDDPKTQSYISMLPFNYDVTSNADRLKTLFKNKKNYFRRYRDMSTFCIMGVYLLSVVDAYVDAELSVFDISHDLSMKLEPTVINTGSNLRRSAVGLQCSLHF